VVVVESEPSGDVESRSNMRSVPGQSDLVESRDGGASQRTSGELSSRSQNHSPGVASDDERPLMYIIPCIVAGLVMIVAGAIAVMYLWKRRHRRRNISTSYLFIFMYSPPPPSPTVPPPGDGDASVLSRLRTVTPLPRLISWY